VGFASCFESAMGSVARRLKLDLAADDVSIDS
jgi:organic hydroperoxide reductase OsmC/OhrA